RTARSAPLSLHGCRLLAGHREDLYPPPRPRNNPAPVRWPLSRPHGRSLLLQAAEQPHGSLAESRILVLHRFRQGSVALSSRRRLVFVSTTPTSQQPTSGSLAAIPAAWPLFVAPSGRTASRQLGGQSHPRPSSLPTGAR